ncbi:ABC transporter ATP-binding protein [Euzebya sp.]|uniref:ABC transporter ATP-binding protein n=1 Tax=Euzebya sp. TaxID=1971409 RepID=UPI003518D0D8
MADTDLTLPSPPARGSTAAPALPGPPPGGRQSVRPGDQGQQNQGQRDQGGQTGPLPLPPHPPREEAPERPRGGVQVLDEPRGEAPPRPQGGHDLPEGWLPCPKGADPAEWVLDPTLPEPKIRIRHLTKAFGSRVIWEDVTFDIPKGKVTVVLGPSGTGKSVLLRHLIGLLRPTSGQLWVDDKNVPSLKNRPLLEVRKKYGVLFQDGALFGSMTIYDNVAFPLREHTRKGEKEIKEIVMHNLEIVGMSDAAQLYPGEISGGMRKRAGLARGLVLGPEILLFDEPDSGLDPVRTAFLNELILDLKERLESTFVIVTHHIPTAKNVGDHLALLYRKSLTLAGPKERLLSSDMPAVRQFLRGSTSGPIGMSEEKDSGDESAEYDPDAQGLEDTRDDEALPGADRPQ